MGGRDAGDVIRFTVRVSRPMLAYLRVWGAADANEIIWWVSVEGIFSKMWWGLEERSKALWMVVGLVVFVPIDLPGHDHHPEEEDCPDNVVRKGRFPRRTCEKNTSQLYWASFRPPIFVIVPWNQENLHILFCSIHASVSTVGCAGGLSFVT